MGPSGCRWRIGTCIVLVFYFFCRHCWPVMATHYLPGSDDGGCQFCVCVCSEETTTAAGCSWSGRAGGVLLGVVTRRAAYRADGYFSRGREAQTQNA